MRCAARRTVPVGPHVVPAAAGRPRGHARRPGPPGALASHALGRCGVNAATDQPSMRARGSAPIELQLWTPSFEFRIIFTSWDILSVKTILFNRLKV